MLRRIKQKPSLRAATTGSRYQTCDNVDHHPVRRGVGREAGVVATVPRHGGWYEQPAHHAVPVAAGPVVEVEPRAGLEDSVVDSPVEDRGLCVGGVPAPGAEVHCALKLQCLSSTFNNYKDKFSQLKRNLLSSKKFR